MNTERKDYDVVVCCVLLRAALLAPQTFELRWVFFLSCVVRMGGDGCVVLTALALCLTGPMAIGIRIGKRHALCSRRFGQMRQSGVLGRTALVLLPLALIMLMETVILIQMGNLSSRGASVGRNNCFSSSSVCVGAFARFLIIGFVHWLLYQALGFTRFLLLFSAFVEVISQA